MMIKRILVPLPGSVDRSGGEIDLAMAATKALGAYAEALFLREPPPAVRGGVNAGTIRYYGGASAAAAAAPINYFAQEQEKNALAARERFTEACAAEGITILPADEPPERLPAAAWREAEGIYVDATLRRAAAFDLIVAASGAVMETLKDIAEQSLLQTRRPVLLAPARFESSFSDTAMIAWDESPECWHAVSAALPFLRLARAVRIVSVDKNRNAPDRLRSQADVLAYLGCHGIKATAQIITPDLRSVGDTLLAAASDHDVGLMVMGAYSHSRLRELLLGGATRHILANASVRPILMAH
jgi:nucleotide-binding universal stress UspA family protein